MSLHTRSPAQTNGKSFARAKKDCLLSAESKSQAQISPGCSRFFPKNGRDPPLLAAGGGVDRTQAGAHLLLRREPQPRHSPRGRHSSHQPPPTSAIYPSLNADKFLFSNQFAVVLLKFKLIFLVFELTPQLLKATGSSSPQCRRTQVLPQFLGFSFLRQC